MDTTNVATIIQHTPEIEGIFYHDRILLSNRHASFLHEALCKAKIRQFRSLLDITIRTPATPVPFVECLNSVGSSCILLLHIQRHSPALGSKLLQTHFVDNQRGRSILSASFFQSVNENNIIILILIIMTHPPPTHVATKDLFRLDGRTILGLALYNTNSES